MKTITKALVGTVAAGAMAITSATPAFADHRDRDRDGISVGDVIAGALIIGGIAAVASAASNNDRDYRYDGRDGYYGGGYDRDARWRGSPRRAVEQCVQAAQQYAASRYGRADVVDIRQVKDTRWGYQVKGTLNVGGGYGRGGDGDDDGGYYGNRGWNDGYRGYDSGSFKCKVERGRIVDLDIDGIRGL